MASFLGKLVIIAIVIVVAVMLVNKFIAAKEQPKPKPKTFYDVIEEDDKRLRADIEEPEPVETEQATSQEQPEKITEPVEITIEDQVQAERLFEMAITQRKMARLPGMTYGQMVNYCREIIEKYPNSPQAPKARRMLGEVPRRLWKRYKITEQEINPSS
ncbi:MAG: hypothetical protein KAS75_01860 [Planctomycetes bacterium]|nr:hypothetical protein [Planctomycetota bacterium]